MKKVAIFMSDFHLGQKNRLEEFHFDNEFAELLGRLSLQHEEDEMDLVLLGDVIDIWTTVIKAKEEMAETIEDIDLYLPADSESEIRRAELREAEKVVAIVRNHPVFFEAIGRFLVESPCQRQVIYVPGNHDHSMVSEKLQGIVRKTILTKNVRQLRQNRYPNVSLAELAQRIQFQDCYENDYLEVYAEHGNQLTYGGIFRYDDDNRQSTFHQFGSECPGYVQFKTVSARGLRRAPKLNGMLMGAFNPANWLRLSIQLLIRGYIRALLCLQRYRIQYQLCGDKPPQVKWARKRLPADWKTLLYLLKARLFSDTHDEFGEIIPRLFEEGDDPTTMPLCGHKLDATKISTVILGHSHGSKDIDVPGFKSLRYYNTGSWILTQDGGRELVEQTWVTVTRELPVRIHQLPDSIHRKTRSTFGVRAMAFDTFGNIVEFGNIIELKCATSDLLTGFAVGDRVIIEKDEKGAISSILHDNPYSRKVIDRQMVRRRVELGKVADSPITTDGTPLNPVLHSMKLRVGDLVLFHWNFGAYLWRIAITHPFRDLPRAVAGVVTGAVNRWGTSSYWNHIAMVFGSPSEREEGHHHNDPLIIESVPDSGVGIHSPRHYLEYPKEWNFAVLRLNSRHSPLLTTWEDRRLLRRITAGYLGAAYDMETVVDGTVKYVALSMEAKGRSALGGVISGAALGFALCTAVALGLAVWHLYVGWEAWQSQASVGWKTMGVWGEEVFKTVTPDWSDSVAGFLGNVVLVLASTLVSVLAVYIALYVLRLITMVWVIVTAAIGGVAGFLIVPVMADIADGWTNKSIAQRIGFVLVWFSPLIVIYIFIYVIGSPIEWLKPPSRKEWKDGFQHLVILFLFSALLTICFSGTLAWLANPIVMWIGHGFTWLGTLLDRLRAMLGWRIPEKSECGSSTIHSQFICSGLLQDALVETARELNKDVECVVVNPDWKASQSRAEQACVFRNTLPKHFALAKGFTWTYLYLDQTLTRNPSPSHKAQAYTAVFEDRTHVPRSALYAIKLGFAGAFMTIIGAAFSHYITPRVNSKFADMNLTLNDLNEDQVKTFLLVLAVAAGIGAIWLAKKAARDLAIDPGRRGRSLAIYGFLSGALATAFGFANLEMLSNIPGAWIVIQWVVVLGVSSAFVLLF